jgi:hypothetical protein
LQRHRTVSMRIRIRDWDKNFEADRSRQWKFLKWVPVPNKQGLGYKKIMAQKNGAEIFGCWNALVQQGSLCEPRGDLSKYTISDLSVNTLIPLTILEKAIDFIIQNLDWIEVIEDVDKNVNDLQKDVSNTIYNSIQSNSIQSSSIQLNSDMLLVKEHRECSELLKKRIHERRQSKIDEKRLSEWDRDVRLMIERDGRTVEQIRNLINECHDMEPTSSGFSWRDNILSMGTLRERWNEGKISIGMNKNRTPIKKFGRQEISMEELRAQAERVKLS